MSDRLREFFQDSPQAWLDIKSEIARVREDYIEKLLSAGCENTDFYRGFINGLSAVLMIEHIHTNNHERAGQQEKGGILKS
jgi:hypothetical protein